MQYRVDGQRIIAFDDQEPLVGEISFPKVPDTCLLYTSPSPRDTR